MSISSSEFQISVSIFGLSTFEFPVSGVDVRVSIATLQFPNLLFPIAICTTSIPNFKVEFPIFNHWFSILMLSVSNVSCSNSHVFTIDTNTCSDNPERQSDLLKIVGGKICFEICFVLIWYLGQ